MPPISQGAAPLRSTHTPIGVLDLRLAGGDAVLPVPDGHTAQLVVLDGEVAIGPMTVHAGEVAAFDRAGADVALSVTGPAHALLLSGEPIDEPVVGHGPFVMNTRDEIAQAIRDYQSGKMGHLR